jgi:hypothetical protein
MDMNIKGMLLEQWPVRGAKEEGLSMIQVHCTYGIIIMNPILKICKGRGRKEE